MDNNEVQDDQEDGEQKSNRRGRPKNENYLPWNEAREFMRGEMIPSRGKFFEWYERNKPKTIPRFPYRVYQKEWISWNDFLGTNNKFNEKVGTNWKPLLEASVFVHSLKLKTQNEWMDYCKVEGQLPPEIPARPDLVYKDWTSWSHWLGNRPVEALQVQKEIQRTQIYYIIHEQDVPGNVFTFGVEPMGVNGLKQRWEKYKFDVIKMYWYDPQKTKIVGEIVNALSSTYRDYEKERIVPNVWELLWHLSMHLDAVKITA